MRAWDVYTYDFPDAGEHPAVIVSHPRRVANKPVVEILLGSTQRAGRMAQPGEVILDEADGLDWPTLVRCDLIHAVPKDTLRARRGTVSVERRRHLVREIIRAHGWEGL